MRTSQSDPILVAFPLLPGLRGRLGLTFAPGKRAAEWSRDLDVDLVRLREEYEVDCLVTLLEDDERERLGIARLSDAANELGMRTLWLPIADGGVPASMQEAIDFVRVVLAVASAGETVVVHCRGGLGRAGTIVACCHVAFGRSVKDAIDAVRVARPGAIERGRQETFVSEFAVAWLAAAPITPSVTRFTGCMLGGAIGDALGHAFSDRESVREIDAAFGPAAPERLPCRPGEKALVSADTQMTIFTCEGVIRGAHRLIERGIPGGETVVMLHALQRWLHTQTGEGADGWPLQEAMRGWLVEVPVLRQQRAPDGTCLAALSASLASDAMSTVDSPPNESKDRGALVRSAPIGLGAANAERAFELARDAAVLTHGHPAAYLSTAYFAAVIHGVSRDVPLRDAMSTADALLGAQRDAGEVVDAVARAIAASPPSLVGTAPETLAATLAIGLGHRGASSDAVGASIWRAVARGGDGVGGLTGSLLGAMFGADALPKPWVMGVELGDVLEPMAIELHATTVLRVLPNPRRYPPN